MTRKTISNASFVVAGLVVGATAATCSQPSPMKDGAARTETSGSGDTGGLAASPAFAAAAGSDVPISDVAESVVPSVVNISATRVVHQRSPFGPMMDDPALREFFGPFGGIPRERRQRSLGSGVIVSGDGVILTNNHVVAKAEDIQVTTNSGMDYDAEVVGSDPDSDLAVVRIVEEAEGLQPLSFGSSGSLRLGEVVLAVGNPFGVGQTVTMGIVSAKQRSSVGIVDYENFIQTDAAINPGNSGGALVNMRGELVGINTAILSRSGGYQGIGFAIPSDMAKPIVDSLLEHGKVIRGWLGVAIQDLDEKLAQGLDVPVQRGVVISDVMDGSPAAEAGLTRGDVIVKAGGEPVHKASRLKNLVAAAGPGETLKLELYRDGDKRTVEVSLGTRPSDDDGSGGDDQVENGDGPLSGLGVAPLAAPARQKYEIPDEVDSGVVVTGVRQGSTAARAGLRPGDVLLEINRKPIDSVGDVRRLNERAGDSMLLLVYRDGGTVYLAVRE